MSSGLAGCATAPTPYPYNPKQSEALNIARAAKLSDVRDIPWDRYQKARDKALAKGAKLDRPSLAGPAISGVATYLSRVRPLPGLGAGKAGTVDFALMWLGKPDSASVQSRLIAWMPRDMARTPEEAQIKMTELLSSAVKSAAAGTTWPAGMRVAPEVAPLSAQGRIQSHSPTAIAKADDALRRAWEKYCHGGAGMNDEEWRLVHAAGAPQNIPAVLAESCVYPK